MNTIEINNLAKDLISKHVELNGWKFEFNTRKTSLGLCSYSKQTISLSSYLLQLMSDAEVKNTLLHEIAHALTKGDGHGNIWRRKFIELGGNGNRTTTLECTFEEHPKTKYSLTCPCCGYVIPKHRKPKRESSCGKCNPFKFDKNYLMVLTEN